MGNQNSTLHDAAAHNDLAKVEAIFQHQNANVNDRDKDGWTPLHFAAYGGALEVTQALLLRGANADPKDKADRTPLHLAALQGHTSLASLLIGRGASVNAKDENDMTPLHKAAIKGNTEVGEQLLRLGAETNGQVKDGTTALHLACWKGQTEFVKLLLSRGANVQATSHTGRTALHEAAESGNSDAVQMLLALGANPYAQDKEGQIPASLATHAGHKDIAELIARGGSTQYQNQGSQPSAPPLPNQSGGVSYPSVYQAPQKSEKAAEEARNDDFWGEALPKKEREQQEEQGKNQGFWSDIFGGGFIDPRNSQPKPNEQQQEIARNKEFWDKELAGGISGIKGHADDWNERAGRAAQAWDSQIGRDDRKEQERQRQNPREEFQDNLLKQAQGVWNMLQGKGGYDDGRRRENEEKQKIAAQQRDDGWGADTATVGTDDGWGKKKRDVPTQELYNLKPYDEDDYEEEPKPKSGPRTAQDLASQRRRLAELELNVDREQGWIRGGSKEEASQAKARRERIKEQEAEIASLKKQLAGDKVTFGGRTGGKDLYSAVPKEMLCPITQEIMHDPVKAGDGYTYERGPIEQWLKSGHNTSPMTGGRLPKSDLVPNHDLRSAIRQWQNR